jgi:hypothetical protein
MEYKRILGLLALGMLISAGNIYCEEPNKAAFESKSYDTGDILCGISSVLHFTSAAVLASFVPSTYRIFHGLFDKKIRGKVAGTIASLIFAGMSIKSARDGINDYRCYMTYKRGMPTKYTAKLILSYFSK